MIPYKDIWVIWNFQKIVVFWTRAHMNLLPVSDETENQPSNCL